MKLTQKPEPPSSPEYVEHPSHYNQHPSGVECITIIQDFPFCIGTAIKHLWRAGLKPKTPILEDLRKAIKYIEFEIARLVCVRCKIHQKSRLDMCEDCLNPLKVSREDAVAVVIEKPTTVDPLVEESGVMDIFPGKKEDPSDPVSDLCRRCKKKPRVPFKMMMCEECFLVRHQCIVCDNGYAQAELDFKCKGCAESSGDSQAVMKCNDCLKEPCSPGKSLCEACLQKREEARKEN